MAVANEKIAVERASPRRGAPSVGDSPACGSGSPAWSLALSAPEGSPRRCCSWGVITRVSSPSPSHV